jgi:hypothetical protein
MKDNRIKELAEQAEEWNADGDKCEVNLQKFAELIIAECAKLCEPAAQVEPLFTGLIAKHEGLAEELAQPERPQNCGSGFCSCIECVMEPAQEPVGLLLTLRQAAYECAWPCKYPHLLPTKRKNL